MEEKKDTRAAIIIIDNWKTDDPQRVKEINERYLPKPEHYPIEFLQKVQKTTPGFQFQAMDSNGKMIGYITCILSDASIDVDSSVKYRYNLYIVSLAIEEFYRRQGIASALISRVIDAVKTYNCKDPETRIFDVNLYVRKHNEQARKLYSKCNFKDVRTVSGFFESPKEDAFFMSLSV